MAGSSGAIRAGKAYVELFANGQGLQRGLKMAEATLKNWGGKIAGFGKNVAATAAGYLSAGALQKMGQAVVETGARLAVMSARTGAGVKSLQTLGYAADRTGGSMEDIGGAMTHIRDQIAAAAAGSDDALKSFALLGLDFGKLASMKPEDQFRAIAAAVNKIPHPAQKAYFATKLLGNADLVPLLGQLGDLEKKADELGIVMDDKTAAAALDFSNAMKDLWDVLQNVAVTIASALAPAAKWLVGVAVDVAKTVRDWVKANLELETSFESIKTGIEVAGAVVYTAWVNAITGMRRAWVEFRTFTIGVMIDLGQGMANALVDAFDYIRQNFRGLSTEIIRGILTLTYMIQKKTVDLSPGEKIALGMAADAVNANLSTPMMRGAVDGIGKSLREENKNQRQRDLKDLDNENKAAQDALEEAMEKARKKREDLAKNKGGAKKGDDGTKPPNASDLMGMASSVMGTFSARAVSGFSQGGNTVFNAIKNATVQTAQNTAQLAKRPAGIGVS